MVKVESVNVFGDNWFLAPFVLGAIEVVAGVGTDSKEQGSTADYNLSINTFTWSLAAFSAADFAGGQQDTGHG